MVKICLVEDERPLKQLISEELEDMGHSVSSAENGEEGLELIARERPDIIICDINMPKLNGYQMLARLKKEYPALDSTPFVFLTAYADKSDIADGMMAGATTYLTKPVNVDALGAWVESLTELQQQA